MILTALAMFHLFTPSPRQAKVYVEPVGAWRLRVESDAFSGVTECSVRQGPLSLGPKTLTVHLGRRVDSAAAVVRLDHGAPRIYQRYDYRFSPDSDLLLSNPSGGVVEIPLEDAEGKRELAVEAPFTRDVRTFDLSGLDAAHQAATQAGCWRGVSPARTPLDPPSP
jgi:hypothetical protein